METDELKTNQELVQSCSGNFELLQKTYNKNYKYCLPFIGSGLTMPTGIDNWDQLLINMNNEFGKEYTDIEKDLKDNKHLEIASFLYKKINNDEKYIQFMNKQIEQSSTLTTSTIIKIVKQFYSIITTNYDTSVQEAHNTIKFITDIYEKVEHQSLPQLDSTKLLEEKNIIYLHGFKNHDKYLLTKENYELFYPTISKKDGLPELEKFIESITIHKNIIFMGFSFNDTFFCDFFKHVINEEKRLNEIRRESNFYTDNNNLPSHFAFIKLKEEDTKDNPYNTSLDNQLKELNIKPIYYENSHLKLETDYIEKIKDYKEEVKLSTQGDFPNA